MLECDVEMERDPDEVEQFGLDLFERYAGELDRRDPSRWSRKQAQKRVGLTLRSHAHGELGPPQARTAPTDEGTDPLRRQGHPPAPAHPHEREAARARWRTSPCSSTGSRRWPRPASRRSGSSSPPRPAARSARRPATGRGSASRIEYIEQDAPLGLAHAVLTAEPFLGDSPFVMYLGDNLLRDGIVALVDTFRSEQPDALILLTPVPDPENYGVAELDGDKRRGPAGGEAEGAEDGPRAGGRLHVHPGDLRRGPLDRAVLARRARDHRRHPDARGPRPARGPAHRPRLVEGHRPGAGHARGQPPDPRRPRGARSRASWWTRASRAAW